MFKVIETTSNCIRLPIMPKLKLKPGMIGKISTYRYDTVIDVADSHNFFGVIGNRRNNITDDISWKKEHLIKIWSGRMVFRTDIYDIESNFKKSALYVNNEGLLSSKEPFEDACIVARLISLPKEHKWIEVLWL